MAHAFRNSDVNNTRVTEVVTDNFVSNYGDDGAVNREYKRETIRQERRQRQQERQRSNTDRVIEDRAFRYYDRKDRSR